MQFVGGSVSEGSELQIEVAEFLWEDVELDGSLIIIADNIMGSTKKNNDGEQILHYGARCGRCKLQSVKIMNEGMKWGSPSNVYWKHDAERPESLKIILHGNVEFEAKNVVLKGKHIFEVPDGHRMCIIKDRAVTVCSTDVLFTGIRVCPRATGMSEVFCPSSFADMPVRRNRWHISCTSIQWCTYGHGQSGPSVTKRAAEIEPPSHSWLLCEPPPPPRDATSSHFAPLPLLPSTMRRQRGARVRHTSSSTAGSPLPPPPHPPPPLRAGRRARGRRWLSCSA